MASTRHAARATMRRRPDDAFCVAARDAMRDLAVRPCEVEMVADRPLALTGSLTRWYLQCCKASGHWRSGAKKTRSLIARTRMPLATKSWRACARRQAKILFTACEERCLQGARESIWNILEVSANCLGIVFLPAGISNSLTFVVLPGMNY